MTVLICRNTGFVDVWNNSVKSSLIMQIVQYVQFINMH